MSHAYGTPTGGQKRKLSISYYKASCLFVLYGPSSAVGWGGFQNMKKKMEMAILREVQQHPLYFVCLFARAPR